jgi:hypothetical protein
MPVSKERLETRLAELKAQLTQLKEQYIATTGAIADLEYWIAEDSKEPTPEG